MTNAGQFYDDMTMAAALRAVTVHKTVCEKIISHQ
jgi:hypothetical protein